MKLQTVITTEITIGMVARIHMPKNIITELFSELDSREYLNWDIESRCGQRCLTALNLANIMIQDYDVDTHEHIWRTCMTQMDIICNG